MILQALCEYYERKAALGEMPPYGYEWKELPYLIVIREDGSFVKLEETYEGEGKQRKAKAFLMPLAKGRSGSNSWKTANSLWDHYGYVLGLPKNMDFKNEDAVKTGEKQSDTFKEKVKQIAELNVENKRLKAICSFYNSFSSNLQAVKADPLFDDCIKKEGTNLAFKMLGDSEPIGTDCSIKYGGESEEGLSGRCLISGQNAPIARLNDSISLRGASPMGAKLVGFQKGSGYDSYHKEQGDNAPISQKVNYAYTTALNSMLAKNSLNHFYFSGETLVFWANKENDFESSFSFFFSMPPKDEPDKSVEVISNLMKAPLSGVVNDFDDTRFYILLLSPNVARIAVKLWEETTVKELAKSIRLYFEDLNIIRGTKDKNYYPLYEILRDIAVQKDTKNLPPMLFNGMIRAAIANRALPALAQMQCVARIKADRKVNAKRAGLLKAYLNRKNRNNIYRTEKDITMALDLENKNQAYLYGRLFAILEKIQEASGTSTIREQYYGAASRTPAVVFPRLLSLSNYHLGKLTDKQKVYYEKLKGSIINDIGSEGFASHFFLDDQSRFAIGYYHQRQDFFTKKNNEEQTEN